MSKNFLNEREEIVKASPVPELPEGVKIQAAGSGSLPCMEIKDISEAGVRKIIEHVRTGKYTSLYLSLDEDGEEGFLMMESSPTLLFLQIWDAENEIGWCLFAPEFLASNEEAPIEPSDGQSVFQMRNTIKNTPQNRELAARCVEWYIHTCEPYPGTDWLKDSQ